MRNSEDKEFMEETNGRKYLSSASEESPLDDSKSQERHRNATFSNPLHSPTKAIDDEADAYDKQKDELIEARATIAALQKALKEQTLELKKEKQLHQEALERIKDLETTNLIHRSKIHILEQEVNSSAAGNGKPHERILQGGRRLLSPPPSPTHKDTISSHPRPPAESTLAKDSSRDEDSSHSASSTFSEDEEKAGGRGSVPSSPRIRPSSPPATRKR